MRFEIGDVVRISRDSEYYGQSNWHPAGINGVIRSIENDSHPIGIVWDNYRGGYYSEEMLKLVRKGYRNESN